MSQCWAGRCRWRPQENRGDLFALDGTFHAEPWRNRVLVDLIDGVRVVVACHNAGQVVADVGRIKGREDLFFERIPSLQNPGTTEYV